MEGEGDRHEGARCTWWTLACACVQSLISCVLGLSCLFLCCPRHHPSPAHHPPPLQSGISPTQETLAIIDDIRRSKFFFATFKVEGVSIVPDVSYVNADLKAQGDAAVAAAFEKDVWPEFIKALSNADGPRFAVIDFSFNTADGRIKKTLTSIGWSGTNSDRHATEERTQTAHVPCCPVLT